MSRDGSTRRELLSTGAAIGIGTLCAGCSSLPGNGGEPSTDLSGSGSKEESTGLIPPLFPSDYDKDEIAVTAFSPIASKNSRETLGLRQQLLKNVDAPMEMSPRNAGKVLTTLDNTVNIFEFVQEADREELRKSDSRETYQGYDLYSDSEGPAEVAIKDPRMIFLRGTERLQVEPRTLMERLIDFARGERAGMGAERTDISGALNAASEKHVRRLRMRLSGNPLTAYEDGATATAIGATIEDGTESPTLSLSASAAAPEGSSPPVSARDRLLEQNPLGLPYDQPTLSTNNHVAMATDSVQGTPGLDENGEPILVDSDMIVEVTAYQFDFEFHLPDVDVTTKNAVTVPNDRPLGFRVQSADVVHSFAVPELRTKVMAYPDETHTGRVFTDALTPKDYLFNCTEYCGENHNKMLGKLHVVKPTEFDTWVNQQS